MRTEILLAAGAAMLAAAALAGCSTSNGEGETKFIRFSMRSGGIVIL